MSGRIESIAVIGGEIAGWSVAAALKRRLPYLAVTVVPAASAAEDLANRLISTLPSIAGFHEDIGLTEADTVARAASAFRLGTRFSGWVEGQEPYLHAYGAYGHPIDATPFHQLWLLARRNGQVPPFDRFSVQAALGAAGRVADPHGPVGKDLQYGLQIDRNLYLSMMTAYAEHLGVRSSASAFASARLRSSDGFVEAALLDDGAELAADLFVDCSGPSAILRAQLGDDFEDWSRWLPCDRILIGEGPPPAEPPALDEVETVDAGWKWKASSPRAISVGMAYASAFFDADAAVRELSRSGVRVGDPIALRQGRRSDPWLRNCVAIGAAAGSLEPLEWTNLHLVHSAVDRIVSMMPGRDCAPIELSECNRQCRVEAERVRDFICLHYVTSRRDGLFWEAARQIEPPPSLAHSLALFRERGRLPFYEEETFSRDSWLAVLFGQGEIPGRVDPLSDLVAPDMANGALSRLREMIATAVSAQPSHETYLRNLFQQAVR